MSIDDRESFVRWQTVTRDYFSAVSNLVLGLATGLLAFLVSGLMSSPPTAGYLRIVSIVSLELILASVALAILCAISRLADFHAIARITRSRYKGEPIPSDTWQETEIIDKLSLRLFYWQMLLFGLGTEGVAITIVAKLWV